MPLCQLPDFQSLLKLRNRSIFSDGVIYLLVGLFLCSFIFIRPHFVVLSKKRECVLLPLSSQPDLETHKMEFPSGNEPGTYKFANAKV